MGAVFSPSRWREKTFTFFRLLMQKCLDQGFACETGNLLRVLPSPPLPPFQRYHQPVQPRLEACGRIPCRGALPCSVVRKLFSPPYLLRVWAFFLQNFPATYSLTPLEPTKV